MATSAPGAGRPETAFDVPGVEWSGVSPRLAAARRLVTTAPLLALAVVAAVGAVVLDVSWLWVVAAVLAALGGWAWWVVGRQVRAWRYAERADDLLVGRGVAWRTVVVVPYGRLQYVDVYAGPVDRLFGLAKVQLHTASARSDAYIPGLPPHEAARLRDRLASRGEARLAGL
ncbi:MAG TPA: PH domain-containing protein [Kineosporiaceae bacterium]|jgi:membrane protein YdbS with pleckstrin-like domain|nr:PH domain-containing protein [Kineosporiaceae bacterium]